MSEVPYVAFSNQELEEMPLLESGDEITCDHCGNTHIVEDSDPPMLLFYKCGDTPYLAGLDGKDVRSRFRKG